MQTQDIHTKGLTYPARPAAPRRQPRGIRPRPLPGPRHYCHSHGPHHRGPHHRPRPLQRGCGGSRPYRGGGKKRYPKRVCALRAAACVPAPAATYVAARAAPDRGSPPVLSACLLLYVGRGQGRIQSPPRGRSRPVGVPDGADHELDELEASLNAFAQLIPSFVDRKRPVRF